MEKESVMAYSVFENKIDCCGCTACANVCPRKAIEMRPDQEGFLYPHIDPKKCTECGLCKRVCDFQKTGERMPAKAQVYALKAAVDIRQKSTSGGAFVLLSDNVLDRGGVVYGAAFDAQMKNVHIRAESKAERYRLCGSKYVQSDLGNIFADVKADLQTGREVLFTGTPCQCAGLKSYLSGVNTEHLLLVDILCHGVPSPAVFADYIDFVERKRGKKVAQYHTRAKDKGYRFNEKIVYTDGSVEIKSRLSEVWSDFYYSLVALRPACYHCKYADLSRGSDITIADFWGIEDIDKEIYDEKGVSLVIVSSSKGEDAFSEIRYNCTISEHTIEEAARKNPNLLAPSKMPVEREAFWKDYAEKGSDYALATYGGYNIYRYIKSRIKVILDRLGLLRLIKK